MHVNVSKDFWNLLNIALCFVVVVVVAVDLHVYYMHRETSSKKKVMRSVMEKEE